MSNITGDAGFGVRDTVKGIVLATSVLSKSSSAKSSSRKSSLAKKSSSVKTAPSKSALSKAPKTARKLSAPAAALKARPDADDTLKLILSRLDDMKAEETVTIDLRGKSAFSDYMIVTSGRANRHVGAIAENVAKGLKETGIKKIFTSKACPIATGC